MPNPWFRMYSEFSSDPKVQSMPEAMQRRLMMLMCLRCCDVLVTLRDEEISFALRITEEELASTKALFLAKKFIDPEWNLLNWDKRQFSSDSSKERTKKYRDKQRGEPVTPPKRHGDATEQNRTDTEQIQIIPPPSPFQIEVEKAAGEIHSVHPLGRRDIGIAEIKKRLISILKRKRLVSREGKPLDEAVPYLRKIVGIHLLKTQSEDWMKEGGAFAKGLENYLAVTMDRYEQEPPPQAVPGTYPVRDGPGNGSTKARMSWRGEAMKDMFYPVETI